MNGFASRRTILTALALLAATLSVAARADDPAPDYYQARDSWHTSMLASRAALPASAEERDQAAGRLWERIEQEWPVQWDWAVQDTSAAFPRWFTKSHDTFTEQRMIRRVLDELGRDGKKFRAQFERLRTGNAGPDDGRWLELYARTCQARRRARLERRNVDEFLMGRAPTRH